MCTAAQTISVDFTRAELDLVQTLVAQRPATGFCGSSSEEDDAAFQVTVKLRDASDDLGPLDTNSGEVPAFADVPF